jgi:serpin B
MSGSAFASQEGVPGPIAEERPHSPAATRSNDLGFELLQKVAQDSTGNALVSPYSIASALLLTWNGAAGETRQAIGHLLGLHEDATIETTNENWAALESKLCAAPPGVELCLANSAWADTQAPIRREFLALLQETLRAEIVSLDLQDPASPGRINHWVSGQTHGKIPQLLAGPIPASTVLYLINAVYFRAQWKTAFDPGKTSEQPFYGSKAEPQTVPQMQLRARFNYVEDESVQVVRLPYATSEKPGSEPTRSYSMLLILPKQRDQLESWLANRDTAQLEKLTQRMAEREGTVALPRCSLEVETTLNDALRALGMGIAFEGAADFSNLSSSPVCISSVLHKVVLDLHEEGTEAAAATSVGIRTTSLGPKPFEFIADHPFYFAIEDGETGTILFHGVLRDP